MRLLLAQPLTNDVRPTKRQRQQRDQLLQAFQLNDVGLLKPEPPTLQTAEQGFNFSALRIIFDRLLAIGRGNHDQILATFEPHPRHKQFQSPEPAGFCKAQGLIDRLLAKPLAAPPPPGRAR